jgi:nucleotide-binding universal stress UspA family protein
MYRQVVIGVDGEAGGRDAIALARSLADQTAELTLVHIYGGESVSAREPGAEQGAQRAEALRLLERERSKAGIDATLAPVAAASVGRGLHEVAGSAAADLIAVGSTHRGGLGRVVLGDDTRGALGAAPCAVAIAPHGYGRGTGQIDIVGVAYDFSEVADAILAVGWEIASGWGAALSALYVAPLPTLAGEDGHAPGWDDFVAAEHDRDDPRDGALEDVDGRITYGRRGRELVAFSEDVDLLIVASRGHGPLRSLIFGSMSNYLADHTRGPLLVVPPAAQALEVKTGRAHARS